MGITQGPRVAPQLLLFLLVLLARPAGTGATITCEAVTTSQETSVTCFFGRNIFDSKHNINVQFYYPDLSADPETPLMCNWVTSEKTECKKGEGITFNNVISDQLQLKGPPMVHKLGGKFKCQVVPSIDSPATPCRLTYRALPPMISAAPEEKMDSDTLDKSFEDINDRAKVSLVISTLTLVVLLIAVVAVMIYFCLTRIREKTRKKHSERPDEEKQTSIEMTETASEQSPSNQQPSQGDVNSKPEPKPSTRWKFIQLFRKSKSSQSAKPSAAEAAPPEAAPPEAAPSPMDAASKPLLSASPEEKEKAGVLKKTENKKEKKQREAEEKKEKERQAKEEKRKFKEMQKAQTVGN